MRILVISNYYPPYALGGQGQSCHQVVTGLQSKGHQIVVLTSNHGINRTYEDVGEIHRELYLEMDLVRWRHSINFFLASGKREKHNLQYLQGLIKEFRPDIIFIWGMWNLSRSIPALAEASCPGRVVYRFADFWPTLPSQHKLYWQAPGRTWYSRLPKRAIGTIALSLLKSRLHQPALKFEHSFCVSISTRNQLVEAGIPIQNSQIIYTGVNVEPFLIAKSYSDSNKKRDYFELIYAGRLCAEKGVDTAIKAIGYLIRRFGLEKVGLSLAGNGTPDYMRKLQSLVAQEHLEEHIHFLGRVPGEKMPSQLSSQDVLILPSVWPEPFARIALEGMISGLVVVATPCGGTSEIVEEGVNGLFFSPGDASDLAEKIFTLYKDPDMRFNLSHAGQCTVMKNFTYSKMMNEIENYLHEVWQTSKIEESS